MDFFDWVRRLLRQDGGQNSSSMPHDALDNYSSMIRLTTAVMTVVMTLGTIVSMILKILRMTPQTMVPPMIVAISQLTAPLVIAVPV
jgi:hypothetical protein